MNRMGQGSDRRGWPLRVHPSPLHRKRPPTCGWTDASGLCSSSRKRKTFASTKREEENVHVGNEYATGRR